MGYSPWGHKESDTTERLTHRPLTMHQLDLVLRSHWVELIYMILTSHHAVSEHLPQAAHFPRSPSIAELSWWPGRKSLLLCIDWPEFYLWPTFSKTCLSFQFPVTAFPVNEGSRIPSSPPLVLHTWVCNGPLRVQPWGLTAANSSPGSFHPIGLFLFL